MALSRAYLNFRDVDYVFRFKQAFDGHAFVNERGTQLRCSIEFAPNQRVARGKGKRDTREGTIEKDADYKEFLQKLHAGPVSLPSAEVQLLQKEAAAAGGKSKADVVVETALMEYLKHKRAKQLKRVERSQSRKGKGVRAKGKMSNTKKREPAKGLETVQPSDEPNRKATLDKKHARKKQKEERRKEEKKQTTFDCKEAVSKAVGSNSNPGGTQAASAPPREKKKESKRNPPPSTKNDAHGKQTAAAERPMGVAPAGNSPRSGAPPPPQKPPRILQRPDRNQHQVGTTTSASALSSSAEVFTSLSSAAPAGQVPSSGLNPMAAPHPGPSAAGGEASGGRRRGRPKAEPPQRRRGRGRGRGAAGTAGDSQRPEIVVLPRPPGLGGRGGGGTV